MRWPFGPTPPEQTACYWLTLRIAFLGFLAFERLEQLERIELRGRAILGRWRDKPRS